MKGIFSILVENKDGVLSQIAGLFSRRGFNIDSLAVGETDKHDVSSITIVSTADARTIDQIEKHLNKKMDVIKVRRLDEVKSVSLEIMLIKVSSTFYLLCITVPDLRILLPQLFRLRSYRYGHSS